MRRLNYIWQISLQLQIRKKNSIKGGKGLYFLQLNSEMRRPTFLCQFKEELWSIVSVFMYCFKSCRDFIRNMAQLGWVSSYFLMQWMFKKMETFFRMFLMNIKWKSVVVWIKTPSDWLRLVNFLTVLWSTSEQKQECIIRFKNSSLRLEFLNPIIHHCESFKRLRNPWYRSTHSCTNI